MIQDEYSNPAEETAAKQEAFLKVMATGKQINILRARVGELIRVLKTLSPRPDPALFHALGLLYMAPHRIERSPFFIPLDQAIAEFNTMIDECTMDRLFNLPSRLNQLMISLRSAYGIKIMKAIYNDTLETIESLELMEYELIVSLRFSDNLITLAKLFGHTRAVAYLTQLRKEELDDNKNFIQNFLAHPSAHEMLTQKQQAINLNTQPISTSATPYPTLSFESMATLDDALNALEPKPDTPTSSSSDSANYPISFQRSDAWPLGSMPLDDEFWHPLAPPIGYSDDYDDDDELEKALELSRQQSSVPTPQAASTSSSSSSSSGSSSSSNSSDLPAVSQTSLWSIRPVTPPTSGDESVETDDDDLRLAIRLSLQW